jgi:hypothetical protein
MEHNMAEVPHERARWGDQSVSWSYFATFVAVNCANAEAIETKRTKTARDDVDDFPITRHSERTGNVRQGSGRIKITRERCKLVCRHPSFHATGTFQSLIFAKDWPESVVGMARRTRGQISETTSALGDRVAWLGS